MALSGEFYGSTNNAFVKPKITWQAVQCPEENYSVITATLSYSRTNTGFTTSGTWAGTLSIGADTKSESRYVAITYGSDTVAITHTARVDHDAYGCAKVELRATGGIPGTSLESTSISQSVQPDTIALASTVDATDAYVEAVCMVAVDRKNAAYTHSIALSCNGYTGFLGADGALVDAEQKLTATAIAFPVPALFYDLMPQSASARVELTCYTYHGDTQVGLPQTGSFTVTARQSLCAPVVAVAAEDILPQTLALTGDRSTLVRYASRVRCQVQAQAQKGAAIVSTAINGLEGETLELSAVEQDTFTATAVDSRGYTAQAQVQLRMVPYVLLTVNANAKRTDPTSGRVLLTVWGNYFDGSFGARENGLTLNCNTSRGQLVLTPVIADGAYTAQAVLEDFDYTDSHMLVITAGDAVMEAAAYVTVKPGIPVFDWGQKDFAFHVPLYANAGLQVAGKQLWELIYPVGAVYMSVAETEPSVLFGGVWEQIKDTFLLAAGDRYPSGKTGGESEHTLTESEMPGHNHALIRPKWYEADGTEASTVYNDFSGSIFGYTGGTTKTYKSFREATTEYPAPIEKAGAGQPHNNMPPYLAVFMWKRIA